MRTTPTVLAAALALALPSTSDAQGTRTRSGDVGQPTTTVAPFNYPTANRVKEMGNVATELIDKRRRLGLDEAALTALRTLETEIDTRNAPAVAKFDSLRVVARANNNADRASTLEGRATLAQMTETARDIAELREADAAKALAIIPADKQDAARAMLADQQKNFDAAFAPRVRAPRRP